MSRYGARSQEGQLLVLTTLLSGLTHHHVAQAAGFFKLQQLFNPSITGFYKKYMASLKTSGAKVVAVDTNFDSPGIIFIYFHEAKKSACMYVWT